ncbi:hypothetical protein AHiyo4_00210 [Arthrobacter sp. Hiyo4]|nr:hypothetical protein AHiyo4_00210 [Arthrobacter sp. Hiyo4]
MITLTSGWKMTITANPASSAFARRLNGVSAS